LKEKVQEKGLTIVPTSLFIAENGFAKLNIALAKGKKEYNKKHSIMEQDIARQMDRDIKNYRQRNSKSFNKSLKEI